MRYHQRLIDLDVHGVFALTLGSTSYAPLPAQLHGFARWHPPAGEAVDCAALAFRTVTAADMRATAERVHSRLARAVASVRGYHEWVLDRIAETSLDAPTSAASLAGGRVLLLFGSEHRPHLLRLVDVPGQRVMWEETVDALRLRLGISTRPFGPSDALLYGAGGDHALLGLGDKPLLLRVGDAGFERVACAGAPDWLEGEFTAEHFVSRDRETLRLSFVPLRGGAPVEVQPTGKKKVGYYVPLAAAEAGDRVALSYEGGLVELIEGRGARTTLMRPLPGAAGKDMVAVAFSPSGRYLVASIHGAGAARLIDLERRCAADVSLPPLDFDAGVDRDHFAPEVRYVAAWAVTDRGGYWLENGTVTHTPVEPLDWQALDAPAERPDEARLAAHVAAWTRPSLALVPAKSGSGASHLYGAPVLGGDWTWPAHEGVPMWLLCELDLAQVRASAPGIGLPAKGALLFFVAVDTEGEPVMRDGLFDPAFVCVLHVATDGPSGAAARDDPWAVQAQPLVLQADTTSDWPQADAALVRMAALSDADLAAYHEWLEVHSPDGAAAGHRLGGYPHLLQSNTLEAHAQALACGDGQVTCDEAARWRLLLQLDSDDVYMWGTDSGMLYFMIRDDDLARADFTQVVALTTGY